MNQMKFKIPKYDKHTNYFLSVLLFVIDYLSIVLAEQSAFVLRKWIVSDGGTLHISWLNFWVVFPLLYLLFLNIEQLYNRRMQFWQVIEKIFQASLYAVVAIVIVLYIGQIAASTSRMFIFLLWLFSFIYLTVFRYLTKKILEKVQLLRIPVLIIGAGKTAELLVKGIINDAGMGYKIIGLLEDNCVRNGILKRFPVLGKFADVEAVILKTGVQHVFIAAPGLEQEKLTRLIYKVQPLVKNIGIIPNLVGIPMGGIEVESLFNEKLMLLRLKNNLARSWNRYLKTIFDFALTLVGTVAISPILIFIAIWIYIDSPGPVIFKHTRIGKNGKKFLCYKFRSMCIDAKEKLAELLENDPVAKAEWKRDFKLKNDPRITKSGAFLRRTSLDELPQIFNVLKGEMSLVGPRPVIEEELERYGEYVNDYLMVKPGITGMWQINGRNDTSYAERVCMDSWYVRNWSIWIDNLILWRTLKSVIRCKGAY
ncbi:undecaprenyl-phosphate galactose phosphotransferase WbaP [uncultured Phascolarctobacterium sp.]|uniref:undecaprenyl-phosphate galactose phosphotransferase WbaP n=1 Tax=uncultured Phascolarctobacterium sp. TaxID=512296 RepID=UPI00259AD12B|nr:undecaprenyl-phosphate galactose phosphotransferase WbaP [uncultured Phascolarctobacterium sp.]